MPTRTPTFLAFLLSKEKDIDEFKEKRRPKVTKVVGKPTECLDADPTDQDQTNETHEAEEQ